MNHPTEAHPLPHWLFLAWLTATTLWTIMVFAAGGVSYISGVLADEAPALIELWVALPTALLLAAWALVQFAHAGAGFAHEYLTVPTALVPIRVMSRA
jgi:hypothetical protein